MSTAVGSTSTTNGRASAVPKNQQLSRRGRQMTKASVIAETPDITEQNRSKPSQGSSIQFVHYSGDTHFEPSKLADVKLYPSEDSGGGGGKPGSVDAQHKHQEMVVRLDLLDIRSDDVYEKLYSLGPRLHSLAIRDLALNYVPKELQPIWPNITSLDLSGNALNEFSISDTLPHLGNISELNLNGNNLIQLPKGFKSLKQLKRLFLSKNKLSSITNLDAAQMQWFVADSNHLQSLDSFVSSSNCATALQVLDVSHNELTTVPGLIRNFRSLVDLDISSNHIRVLPIELFKLQSLQFLNASCNRISHVPSFSTQTSSFSRSQLRTVDLSDNVLSKLPEHLLFLADKLDVANNSIKFIRGNLLQKLTFSSKKQLRIEGNPLLFPPASLVANDGLRGLLSFFGAIKNKVKRRQGLKVFVVGATHGGKTSFIKSLVDEFPHLAEEPTILANYDEIFVDIDAPGEIGQILPAASSGGGAETAAAGVFITSRPQTPAGSESVPVAASPTPSHTHSHTSDDACCQPTTKKDGVDEDNVTDEELPKGDDKDNDDDDVFVSDKFREKKKKKKEVLADDIGNDYNIGLPREFAAVRRRAGKNAKRLSISSTASDTGEFAGGTNKAALWKCVQMPVLDISGRGIFATLRKYLLEDCCLYVIVFNLASFPANSPAAAQWYRENVGTFIDEIFVLCREAYVILVGSFVDKLDSTSGDVEAKCNSVLALAKEHQKTRQDSLTSQIAAIEAKAQVTMADQDKLLLLRTLLEKQKVRLCDRVVTFSSLVEGTFPAQTLSTLIELLQSGAAHGEAQDPFFKAALEPITNLHSDIIEYIELLATSMRFPIVDNKTFEDIFFKEYQIISEQIVKRIPKFLHLTGHIFWSLKNDVLSELVCLRPEFVTEFLVALFSYVFDEKPLHAAMSGIAEAGRRLYQLGANEVREASLRFVRAGILQTHVGELLVRKALNIKASDTLQATVSSIAHRNSDIAEFGENASATPSQSAEEPSYRSSEPISSAPIHVCVEKFCVGFQMAYFFDCDSLEYSIMYHPRIAEIDLRTAPIRIADPSMTAHNQQPTTTTTTAPTQATPASVQNNANQAGQQKSESKGDSPAGTGKEPRGDRKVSFAAGGAASKKASTEKSKDLTLENLEMATAAPIGDKIGSPTKKVPSRRASVISNDGEGFFLKFPTVPKVVRQPILSAGTSHGGDGGSVSGRRSSKSPSLHASSSVTPTNLGPGQRYLLFPALRPLMLPEPFRLAIADAWESLSTEMWIGASLSFPTNFYPPSAFHEIVTRVRRKVNHLEFGYVWQKGAFGKFVNSSSCFVKMIHHTCAPIDCDFDTLLADNDPKPAKGDQLTDTCNTITFELRTNPDVPSPESAKLAMVAGFMFNEKTLRDYVMNLWERLYEILSIVEEYCGVFAALLIERRVRCPFCSKLSFIGEWTSPRELQAFHEKHCPNCEKVVDTAYLVQPKSSQRELCERIMKDIQKRRAGSLLASEMFAPKPNDSSSDEDLYNIRDDDGGDDLESIPPGRHPVRRRAINVVANGSSANSAVSTTSSKSSKKSARMFADRDELLSMMTSNS